jgi:hypothetical protein
VLARRQGCHDIDSEAILVVFRWEGGPAQEGSPRVYVAGVFSVFAWIHMLLMQLLLLLLLLLTFMNSKSDLHVVGAIPRQL